MPDSQIAGNTARTTCGQGLAAHAPLVAKIGEFIAALAENLEAHLTTLDLSDQHARAEREVYVSLGQAHRSLAERLATTAAQMADQLDLPMARHDSSALHAPVVVDAYKRYIEREEELIAVLAARPAVSRP